MLNVLNVLNVPHKGTKTSRMIKERANESTNSRLRFQDFIYFNRNL